MSGDPPRICYLANAASVHTRKWALHFASRGYEVHIASLQAPQEEMPGVTVHRLWIGSSGKHSVVPKWAYVFSVRRARRLLKWLQPDLLHVHYATGYGLLGALTAFHPYIISVWGSDILEFPRRSLLHRAVVEFNLGRAEYVCSTSRYMALKTRKYTAKEVVLTPFGVDCEQFRPKPNRNHQGDPEITIGTVKTLEKGYGIEYLIHAFAALVSKRMPHRLKLLIVGEGSQREALERVARALGIAHLTEFAGWVPHNRVPEYLQRLSVFVAPSVHEESFGMAVVEASACGIPVIVSRIGGMPEVAEDKVTGLLVPPRDFTALAVALEKLVRSEELRRRMGEAGRDFVLRRYEWKTTARVMEDLYKRIFNPR